MANNKRELKAWVRYNSLGQIVPGSNILARKAPKVGHWERIQAYQCCETTTSTTTNVAPR